MATFSTRWTESFQSSNSGTIVVAVAGLDISSTEWICCVAGVPTPTAFDVRRVDRISLELPDLLTSLAQGLQINSLSDAEHRPEQDRITVIKRLVQSYAAQLDNVPSWDSSGQSIAVTFPCCVPPPIRVGLPILVGHEARARSSGPTYWSIESPVAMCLDLVAGDELELPAELFLVSPCPLGCEVTHVNLARQGDALDVQLLAVRELCLSDDSPPVSTQIEDWPAAEASESDRRIYVCGERLRDAASQVASGLGISLDRLEVKDDEISSRGAARYAAMRDENVLHKTSFTRTDIRRIIAWPLGVLGTNEAGNGYWMRLLAPGSPLESTHQLAASSRQMQQAPMVVLAECTKFQKEIPRWLTESDWSRFGMRMFASSSVPKTRFANRGERRLVCISLHNTTGSCLWTRNRSLRVKNGS